ncbi:serine O-acetyltransferase [Roseomonas sp. OT10]|uniref:serine O-acetyltransferase n=1 Tax=Roseomonas cutis TaxID=2897332 RepID=UPI001E60F3DF|nr:serine O-acetyltransferase [Roseomonas sp. OT10]UFN49448.1 serine O-acetyltransferase [Roseomonas sp. OT10]
MPSPCLALLPGELDESSPAAGLWARLRREAKEAIGRDALLAQPLHRAVLGHGGFAPALGYRIARKLGDGDVEAGVLAGVICEAFVQEPEIVAAAAADLRAVEDRDPACPDLLTPFLYFKGYQALQAYRVSHWLWHQGRMHLARHLHSRVSECFGVDIHPAARLGRGIMLDHSTGIVIGETAVVEDDVSILQGVTLGGTGKECGDRHPKIRRGVLIGAGAKILGNIEVATGAKVGAGSIVLEDVPPYTTVVGVPAKRVGRHNSLPALTMDQSLPRPEFSI